jgi:hypothetical protein
MSSQRAIIDVDTLSTLESSCRKRLAAEPEDTQARSNLAWCLFMQAVHQSGQENLLSALYREDGELREKSDPLLADHLDRDAYQILRDCLQQAVAVVQLSPDERHQSEVGKLHQLIRLSGGEQALQEAEAEAGRIISELTRDLLNDVSSAESPRTRRVAARRPARPAPRRRAPRKDS